MTSNEIARFREYLNKVKNCKKYSGTIYLYDCKVPKDRLPWINIVNKNLEYFNDELTDMCKMYLKNPDLFKDINEVLNLPDKYFKQNVQKIKMWAKLSNDTYLDFSLK